MSKVFQKFKAKKLIAVSMAERYVQSCCVLTSEPCFQMINAGLEIVCLTKQVRLRILPDSMKIFGLPKIDATGSAII